MGVTTETIATTPAAEPYWEGLREGKLRVPRCIACSNAIWPPRSHCAICYSAALEWIELSGEGTVYSYSILNRGQVGFRLATPYALAYIACTDGPVILANIIDSDLSRIHIGMKVRLRRPDPEAAAAEFEPIAAD